jgi:hypothetical protein
VPPEIRATRISPVITCFPDPKSRNLNDLVLIPLYSSARGSRVLYFAGYKQVQDRYKLEEIEHAADCVVWCCDEAPGFVPGRPHSRALLDSRNKRRD